MSTIYERPIDVYEQASIYKSWLAGKTVGQLESKFKRGAADIRRVIRHCKAHPPAMIKHPYREIAGDIN